MKHKNTFFAVLIMVLAIPSTLNGQTFTTVTPSGHTISCTVLSQTERTLSVGKADGFSYNGHLIIPDSVERAGQKFAVKQVGLTDNYINYNRGFNDRSEMTEVTLPNTITVLGNQAFKNCTSLTSVSLPNQLEIIGYEAFRGCTGLQSCPTFPNSLKIIKCAAFYGCSNMSGSLIIPNSVDSIESIAFCYFWGASSASGGITSLVLGDSIKYIGSRAFAFQAITTITIPASLQTYGGYAGIHGQYEEERPDKPFFGCSNLTTVYYNAVSAESPVHYNHYYERNEFLPMFPSSVQTIMIGPGVEKIPMGMFDGLVNLTDLTHLRLPASVTSIGSYAFKGCTQIVDAVIPAQIESIGISPFAKCTSLHKVEYYALDAEDEDYYPIPASRDYAAGALGYNNVASSSATPHLVQELPPYDTIIIGPGVTQITSALFGQLFDQSVDSTGYNQDIVFVNNSNVLRRIGRAAFANMQINNFDWGDSLKVIESGAFMNCQRLTKIDLPDGIEQLGDIVFANCRYIDSVLLPQSLTTIGLDCFRNSLMTYLYFDCESLETYCFELPHSDVRCGNTPFGQTINLTNIIWGPHVKHLGDGIFANAEGLVELTLPEGLESIGNDCFRMFSAYYPTSETTNVDMYNNYADEDISISPKTVFVGSGYYAGEVSGIWLNKVSFPSTLTSIGENAFSTGICRSSSGADIRITPWLFDTVKCFAATAPSIADNTFHGITDSLGHLIIPCGSFNNYNDTNTFWHKFTNINEFMPYDVSLTVNIDTMGTVVSVCTGTQSGGHPGVRLTATPAADHRFVQWSDGVTTNPRTFYLSQDTAFEAQFAWGVLYQITARSSNNSRGSVTGSGTFIQNSIDTLVAIPNYGYHFTQWNDGDTTNPRYLTVTSSQTLTATFQPNQYSLTVQSADSTQGSVSGDGTYNYYTLRSISASPATGYHFTSWSDGVTTNPRNVRITQDTSFTAQFAINIYTLTVSSANATMGSASSDSTQYEHGTTATLTATPNYGYHFTQWNDGDTTNPRLYTMTQNKTFSAQFAPNQYTVTLTTDTVRGSIVGGGTYSYLSNTTLTATPYYGYYFSSWSDGDTNNPRYLSVTGDTSLSALFSKSVFHVTVSTNASWQGSAQVSNEYPEYLDTVTLTAIPNYGYHFAWWSDGQADSTDNPRQVVVTGNKNVCAIFLTNQYSLTLDVDSNIHGSVSGAGLYDYYAERTIFATPSYGYHFSAWSDGDTNNPRIITLTQDTSFTALFLPNQYTLEVLSSDTDLGQTYGSGTYNYLDTVPFGVTNIAPHYHFTHWENGSTDSVGLIVIYGDDTLTAFFAIDTHAVSVTSSDIAWGMVETSGTRFVYGTPCTVSATAYTGYVFTGWSNGITANPYTFAVLEDIELTALFEPEPVPEYTITVENANPEMGTVGGGGTVTEGDSMVIWAISNPSYHFLYWNDGSTDSVYTIIVTSDATYVAYFAANSDPEGIEIADDVLSVTISVVGGHIVVDNSDVGALPVQVHDVMGRQYPLYTSRVSPFTLPNGVYLIKIGNHPARRVVVVR